MSKTSPSTTKVNDFLSSLSLLSQQRFQEDDQRQRQLQRNLDELKKLSSSPNRPIRPSRPDIKSDPLNGIPLLKFNRNAPPKPQRPYQLDLDEMTPPPMPQRPSYLEPSPPPKPARPTDLGIELPPPKPKRPDIGPETFQSNKSSSDPFSVLLLRPTASTTGGLNSKSNGSKFGDSVKSQDNRKPVVLNMSSDVKDNKSYISFTEMETGLRKDGRSKEFDDHFVKQSSSELKGWLYSAFENPNTLRSGNQSAIKPLNISISKSANPMSFLDSAVSKSPESKKLTDNTASISGKSLTTRLHQAAAEVPKKAPPKPFKPTKAVEPANEALQQLERLRKSPTKKESSVKADLSSGNDQSEFLNRFSLLKKTNDSQTKHVDYKKRDNLLLQEKLTQILEKKAPPKPSKPTYQQKDSELIQNQLKRLSSTKPTSSVSNNNSMRPNNSVESINALLKLKKQENPAKDHPKTSAIQSTNKLEARDAISLPSPMIANSNGSNASLLSKISNDSSLSIQDKLSTLMRVSTAPDADTGGVGIRQLSRPSTFSGIGAPKVKKEDTKERQLLHANKSRAKGPKRRLPKDIKTGKNAINDNQDRNETVIENVGNNSPNASIISSDNHAGTSVTTSTLQLPKRGLKPPRPTKPTRIISGELFL